MDVVQQIDSSMQQAAGSGTHSRLLRAALALAWPGVDDCKVEAGLCKKGVALGGAVEGRGAPRDLAVPRRQLEH